MRSSSLREIPGKPRLFKSDYGYILVVGLKRPPDRNHMHGLSAIVPSNIAASLRHLVLAALRASRSIKRGVNIADVFTYELGICLIGTREISKVISAMRRDCHEGYALVAVCENSLECRSMLMDVLMEGAILGDVRATYEPENLPTCSNIEDTLAMEKGALVELDR